MAATVVLGNLNLALLIDATAPRNAVGERGRSWSPEMVISWAKRELATSPVACHGRSFQDYDVAGGEAPRMVNHRRRGVNSSSKVGAVGSDGGNGGGDEDDLEMKLRSRLKDLEEMKELERRAEELQRSVSGEGSEEDGDGPESEEEKRERVKRELEKLAKEQAERRETAELMFELGQKAYGKGMYARAIEFLEAALTIIPRPTAFGGEIQIWLAMAYEANNRHRDCIALYQQLEKKHPSISIRRQAAELRYILEAPKLKISKDEMVTIPLIGSSYDWYAGSWSDKYKNRGQRRKVTTTDELPSSRDLLGDFLVWRPPTGWEKNRAFWITLTLWLGLLGTALLLQQ
ncbi:uncharacterized protein LOC120259279 [Dioscorea cayenensis subsp. rotundata]|uniref:Uncharacterized protein LOC120259279 n=1 Tax=Dioscorea cayennensis subsp. rotundata TaxID=55577 RepID=A0AB40B6E8_DIOCR|nr:uncharacterized protein LOC120259279 [Dioscorea cayenensis subsp. rotundata]